MAWSAEENTRSILAVMAHAAAAGVRFCVFPELAVTGFHRQIRTQAVPDLVQSCLQSVGEACRQHALVAVLGAPTFGAEGRVFNSCVFIDECGQLVGAIEKNGLTPAEETFFTRGALRPTMRLASHTCSAVLCREIDDLEDVHAQLADTQVELLFWPGAMRPAVDGSQPDPQAHVKKAQQLARRTHAFIVQANWPNSLNYPDESVEAGRSVVVDPAGEVLLTLPTAEAGVAVFALGESTFEWHPQDAIAPPRRTCPT